VFYPTQDQIYYYAEKKQQDYEVHYQQAALQVKSDSRFVDIPGCWGTTSILEAAKGNVRGKSPSFWISVRMNIHLHQQIQRQQQ
jgi:hypothetical protein